MPVCIVQNELVQSFSILSKCVLTCTISGVATPGHTRACAHEKID